MPRGVYERKPRVISQPYGEPTDLSTYATAPVAVNGHGKYAERIYWNESEVKLLAKTFVEFRLIYLFDSSMALMEKAQRKCLDGSRQRNLTSLTQCKDVIAEINRLMLEVIAKLEAVTTPLPPPPEPITNIVTIEVPRKLTAEEMLAAMDEPALEALLRHKQLARENRLHDLLASVATQLGGVNVPKVQPHSPRFEIFDSGQKKVPRIAIVGVTPEQHELINGELVAADLHAIIRFPDGKDKETVSHCDYAIICRNKAHNVNVAESDRAIGQLGRSRIVLLDESATSRVVQSVRDILSRR